jgi:valyl-tRNA synthetase
VSEEISTYVKAAGLIDIKLEIDRVKKRNAELTKYIDGLNKKTSIPNYEAKVPANVRQENSDKLNTYKTEFEANEKSVQELTLLL